MTTRRAFLAGAGALAVAPLLPPVPAGEMVTATAAKEAGFAAFGSVGGDVYFATNTGIWLYRHATESFSKIYIPEEKV
jgi:hypothetical protein